MAKSSATLPWVLFGTVTATGAGALIYHLVTREEGFPSVASASAAFNELMTEFRMGYKSLADAVKGMTAITYKLEALTARGEDVPGTLALMSKMGKFAEQLREYKAVKG